MDRNITLYKDGIVLGDEYVKFSVDDFITYLFNTFNGRINICNPAVLDICHLDRGAKLGETKFPGIVIINEMSLIKLSKNIKEFIVLAMETIIHELHHDDQVLMSTRVNTDSDYTKSLEVSVEFMTYSYIMNNLNAIIKCINDYFEMQYITMQDVQQYLVNYTNTRSAYSNSLNKWYQYNRTDQYDHILVSVLNMLGYNEFGKDITNLLYKVFEDESSTVFFIINDKECPIRFMSTDGEMCLIDMVAFNEFIYDAYFKYDYHGLRKKDCELLECENNVFIFKLKTALENNTMAKVVK